MKILACDYDGTLNRGGGVTQRDIEAIQRWQAAGNLFGTDSGRSWDSLFNVWHGVPIAPDFVIASTGTQVYDRGGRLLLDTVADGSRIHELCSLIFERGGYYIWIGSDYGRWMLSPDGKFPENTKEVTATVETLPQIPTIRNVTTYFDNEEIAVSFCREMNERFKGYYMGCANVDMPEITPYDANKGKGLANYIKYMDLQPEEIIVAGDSGNDLPMLTYEGFIGYVPYSGSKYVLEKVGRGVADIAEIIEKHI